MKHMDTQWKLDDDVAGSLVAVVRGRDGQDAQRTTASDDNRYTIPTKLASNLT